jgi:hypothetical protein
MKLGRAGTNDKGIGVEPALFVQTMRTFVTRLMGVYHETLAHICIIVRSFMMFPLFEFPSHVSPTLTIRLLV